MSDFGLWKNDLVIPNWQGEFFPEVLRPSKLLFIALSQNGKPVIQVGVICISVRIRVWKAVIFTW